MNVAWDDYLTSDKEWEVFNDCVKLMLDRGMTVWLYDEDGYPSGTAGGKVLEKNPQWEAQGLFCVPKRLQSAEEIKVLLPPVGIEWASHMLSSHFRFRNAIHASSHKI